MLNRRPFILLNRYFSKTLNGRKPVIQSSVCQVQTGLPSLKPHGLLHSGLCSLLPQRLQRAAPGDDLVEHVVDRLLLLGTRLEDAEVFEVGKQGEQDLVAHGRRFAPRPSPDAAARPRAPRLHRRSSTKPAALLFHSAKRKSIAFLSAPEMPWLYSGVTKT